MKQTLGILGLLIAAGIVLTLVFSLTMQRNVSMLMVNGVIHTLDEHQPVAEAVAVRGDRIVAVGTTDELRGRFTVDKVIDLGGRPVYPGFIDSHAHLESLGAALMEVNLAGARSADEAAAMVAAAARDTVRGGWIRGRGWDQNRWPGALFPTHEILDRVSPDIPVILRRVDGHAVWVNKKVLDIAGINENIPDPPGGKILRDRAGKPSGVFIDNAVALLDDVLPPASKEERTEAVRRGVAACIASGLTEVHDMGVDSLGIEIYKTLIAERAFPFRVYVAIEGSSTGTWDHYRTAGPIREGYDGRLRVRALKLYADGALGSRGAALLESYSDDPGNRGLTLTSRGELLGKAKEALESGFQMCTHAIGDRANGIVLDVYEEALGSVTPKARDVRFRVEHAQVLTPRDIPRFKSLGVLPMMQPTHCTSDMPWSESRLGPVRIKGAYAWRSLMAQGSIIPGGSDFPVESPNPLWGFYAAITRQDREGKPPGGWFPEQRMAREEALKSFTLWGAYAGFQEKEKGTIEPGKWADLVVLSKDIMTIEPDEVLTTSVEMTIVAGTIVYAAGPSDRAGAR